MEEIEVPDVISIRLREEHKVIIRRALATSHQGQSPGHFVRWLIESYNLMQVEMRDMCDLFHAVMERLDGQYEEDEG